MKSIIASHNKVLLSKTTPTSTQPPEKECNCRRKSECPLEGKCLQTKVVYQATVTSESTAESYVGLATNFKERYRNHKTRGGGGCTPLFGLYGDVPLDRVWFFGLAVLNRVCNLTCLCPKQVRTCPKQGMVLLFFFLSLPPGA